MALASKGTFLNVTLADEAGNKSTVRYDLSYADLAALSTAVTAGDVAGILAALNAVTDAQIVGYAMGQSFAEDADFYGAAGSEVENIALISAKIDSAVPGQYASLRIPAPNIGIFEAAQGEGKNIVDITDVALQTYLALFDTGACRVSGGEVIENPATAGNFKGKRIHRASRNG